MTNTSSPHTILMGDPRFFSIKGGANPHTRSKLGIRKSVDRELAIRQWTRLKDSLSDWGVRVWVVPPDSDWPGLVYPANAGFLAHRDDPSLPLSKKLFRLSNMIETRTGETSIFRNFLEERGFRCVETARRFEGEADLIPAGEYHIFTSGRLERQRFRPAWAFPPWRRVYGFRSDPQLGAEIRSEWDLGEIIEVGLIDESHYHGDTAIAAFGAKREFLLLYRSAIEPESWARLLARFRDRIVEMSSEDARLYAANSFQTFRDGRPLLVMPAGISDRLVGEILERKTDVETVDVSEFWKKGGGSVKCMIGDLGRWLEG